MPIDVSRIVKYDGATQNVDYTGMIEDPEGVFSEVAFDSPVTFKGAVVNNMGILKLDGVIETIYHTKCGRCLADMDVAEKLQVSELIYRTPPEDEPDAYTYSEQELDIDRIMKDNLILDLPLRQICSKDCKGLCGECGTNLNEGPCDCSRKKIDPRLEALKKFEEKQ
jgi:uncharacterized protein